MSIVRPIGFLLVTLLVLTSCRDEVRPPPPPTVVAGLPLSGSLADARRAGFTACVASDTAMRCRREGVSFEGTGPLSAAVDLVGGDGAGGFDHLVLWHATEQSRLIAIVDRLRNQGWSECLTPQGSRWADRAVYHKDGAPFFLALDRSYWSTRRLTVHPAALTAIPRCAS